MDTRRRESEPTPMKHRTTVERKAEREVVVTRTFNGPARIVFEAWTKPELFRRWWVPKSMGMSLRSCEMDVRVGGEYRLEFEPDAMAFFGTYLEVTPNSRLVWTNEEGGEGGPVTTVTFEETRGKTLLVMHELHSSKEALDAAGTGAADVMVDIRATGRASGHPRRERGTVMKSSISLFSAHLVASGPEVETFMLGKMAFEGPDVRRDTIFRVAHSILS